VVSADGNNTFSVATWNVNSILAHETQVLDWLEARQPSVLAMQETQCANVRFPKSGFAAIGYELATHGDGGSNGVAIASRVGLSDVQRGVNGAVAPFNEPRILSALVNGVRVTCAYAPNGRKVGTEAHRFKLSWFSFLATIVEHVDEASLVLLADLNIAPTDNDVWDAHRYRNRNLTSPDERRAFERLLAAGLIDVVREYNGDVKLSSWWNRRGDFFETNRGWRLDHVLTSAGLGERVISTAIDRETRRRSGGDKGGGRGGGSDHAPVFVEFSGGGDSSP
jgi:exodeoxyribonuclease III